MENTLVEIRGAMPSTKTVLCDSYTCSGFCVLHEGKKYILTNSHCIGNSLFIHSIDGNRYPTSVAFQCKLCDLALLESDFCEALTPIEIEYTLPNIGDPLNLYSVHNDNINRTSGVCRTINVPKSPLNRKLSLFIDAQILSGDSGGPVTNKSNKVIGVIFYGHEEDEYSGYALAYPAIKNFFDRYKYFLKSGKHFTTVNLLLRYQTLYNREQLQRYYGVKGSGVLVTKSKLVNNEAFDTIRVNDVILKINDKPVKNNGMISAHHLYSTSCKTYNVPFTTYISHFIPGEKFSVTVLRDRKEVELAFVAKEAYFPRDIYPVDPKFTWGGLSFWPLSMELIQTLYDDGVVSKEYIHMIDYMIENVDFGSRVKLVLVLVNQYYSALDVNDWVSCSVLKSVNDVRVKSVNHLKEILAAATDDVLKMDFYTTANQLVIDPKAFKSA